MAWSLRVIAMAAALAVAAPGCSSSSRMWHARFVAPRGAEELAPGADTPFLKVHLRDGQLLVLDRWQVNAAARRIDGSGLRFDAGRRRIGEGPQEVSIDEVALLEASRPELVTRSSVKTLKIATWVVVGLDALFLGGCLAGGCVGGVP